jgi:hypothetical protein
MAKLYRVVTSALSFQSLEHSTSIFSGHYACLPNVLQFTSPVSVFINLRGFFYLIDDDTWCEALCRYQI